MNEPFELWDAESANLIGTYDTEDAALVDVLRVVLMHGRGAIDTVILSRTSREGRRTPIATGAELAARAEASNGKQAGAARAGQASRPA